MKKKYLCLIMLFLCMGALALYSQQKEKRAEKLITIKGTVTDNTGKRVSGASIVSLSTFQTSPYEILSSANDVDIEGFKIANGRGQFSMQVPENDTLRVSGYDHATQYVPVNGRTNIEITLIKNKPVKTIEVTGAVKDEEGNPLRGIFIDVKPEGEEKVLPLTMTLNHGFFHIKVPLHSKLLFYNQDYEKQEIPVEEGKDIEVVMQKRKIK